MRFNWAGVICAAVVWSRFLEAVSTSAMRIFLNNRTPISARFGHGCVRSCRKSLHIVHSGSMPACHEVGGKPYPHKSPSDSSGTCPSTHEAQQQLPMKRYFGMDMLSKVMWLYPKQSEIRRLYVQFLADPCSRKMRSSNFCARSPLTRDLSGLGFTELQNGHGFTTCWKRSSKIPGFSKSVVLFLNCAVDMWECFRWESPSSCALQTTCLWCCVGFHLLPFCPKIEVSSVRSRESLDTFCGTKPVGSCHSGSPSSFPHWCSWR